MTSVHRPQAAGAERAGDATIANPCRCQRRTAPSLLSGHEVELHGLESSLPRRVEQCTHSAGDPRPRLRRHHVSALAT